MSTTAATKFALNYPIYHGEETIFELELKRPTFKDIKKIKISDLDSFSTIVEIAAKLSGKPLSIFDAMDASDVIELVGQVTGFLQNSPKIQEKLPLY